MARKAIVDRNTVLQLLKEGKTSQYIASQFGVSRQAIDLHRKEFIRTGLLQSTAVPLPISTTKPSATIPITSPLKPETTTKPKDLSLDEMIELIIQAFTALKRIPELETEVEKYHRDYNELLKKNEQLEELEKKRKEQEARWLNVQHSDVKIDHRP